MLQKVINLYNKIKEHWFISVLSLLVLIITFSPNVLGTYLWHLVVPEPSIYIFENRFDTSGSEDFYGLNTGGFESYLNVAIYLYDVCGKMYINSLFAPKDYVEISKSSADFFRTGQENLTYSISILTNKRKGYLPIHVYSETDFKIETMTEAIRKESESTVYGYKGEKINIDLSLLKRKHEALFDIIPKSDKEIKIDCIDIKNCKIIPTRTIIMPLINTFGGFRFLVNEKNGSKRLVDTPFPPKNFSKFSVYKRVDVNNGSRFSEVTTNEKTDYQIYAYPSKCGDEGRAYIKAPVYDNKYFS